MASDHRINQSHIGALVCKNSAYSLITSPVDDKGAHLEDYTFEEINTVAFIVDVYPNHIIILMRNEIRKCLKYGIVLVK
jgi:hypothetical protein